MTIRYVTAPADMGAFHDWWLRHAPAGSAAVKNQVVRASVVVALLGFLMAWMLPSLTAILLSETLIGVGAIILLVPPRLRKNACKQVVKIYSTPENAALFGQRTLEINGEGILSVSASATALYKWESIAGITTTDTHAFLTVGSMMALVIPRGTVNEGSFDQFVAEARRLYAANTGRVALPAAAVN